MPSKHLFAQITKVNAADRTVTGIAMQEVVDRTLEKCLYEESKPYFVAWSDSQAKASNGKSKGNVREMHTSSAVGVVKELVCDDTQKAFVITTEVVDDAAWKKVEKGVYTGFSIGANFAKDSNGKSKKSMVDGVLEWVADPVEVSLVDIPCVPTALFEYKDAAGHVEQRKFTTGDTQKSMYSVSDLAGVLNQIQYVVAELQWEAEWENDGSKIPGRLLDWMKDGAGIFLDLAQEETSEFAALLTTAKAAGAERLKKASGCFCTCDACADCAKKKALQPTPETDMTPEQTKAFTDAADQMKAAAEQMKAVTTKLDTLQTTVDQTKAAAEETKTTVTGIEERLKAVETSNKEFDEFLTVLGNEPAQAKTQHPAVAVAREPEAKKGLAEVVGDKPLTDSNNDLARRIKALNAVRADSANVTNGTLQ